MQVKRWALLGILVMAALGGAFFAGALAHKYRAAIRARLSSLQDSPVLQTNLYNVKVAKLAVPGEGRDGSIDVLGDGLLLVTRNGNAFHVSGDRVVKPLALKIPINAEEFASDPFNAKTTDQDRFSVKDVLVQPVDSGVRILASHLFWHRDRSCNALRVSATQTTIPALLGGEGGAGAWRTVLETSCRELNRSADSVTRHVTLGAGGRLALLSEQQLLLTVGEFTAEYESGSTADSTDLYGKTVLVDLARGTVSEYTRGHRNAQGLAIGADGRIWETEHGARGGDELNLLVRGRHYGAPYVTYGTQYEMLTWPRSKTQGKHEGYERPMFSWVPSIATSQLIVLGGRAFPWWSGDLLVGTLASQSLYRVRVEQDRVIFVEPMFLGHRVRDLVETPSGAIAIKTDDNFIVYLDNLDGASAADLDPVTRGQLVAGQCQSCHTLQSGGRAGIGPNLFGVVDRRVAAASGYQYSDALRRVGGTWTTERLRAFVSNPEAFAPGSRMVTTGRYTSQQLDDLIAYLQTLR
ncbi:MAG TPA: PQQ-dependent sugar dehydrogenase [Gemmatimonadaceae bacterium]|nr:PQQ-dependent sugar dehydrogenase [Gemmatimonadaceae bacterium]